MKINRTITIAVISAAVAMLAAVGIFRNTTPVRAQDELPPPTNDRFSFGMVGLTPGQTMRINVANIISENDTRLPQGPVRVILGVRLANGQLARTRGGDIIRRIVLLDRGDSTFLDVDHESLPPSPIRVQLRAVVSVIPPPVNDVNALQDGVCIPSVEVISSSNGKTLFMNPSVIRGFNPQPDPPMPE